ncbi:extracellular solute-binding protein [Oligoflexus tunisiensis]|uniref:extracellular solute-binding protein n=1 Tax=Oligoflexus tunisiensis TaxID=708132 RepID=UPI00159F1BF4|nr:extracellular solute-binding protein [Oligoflexus tunisiensis]
MKFSKFRLFALGTAVLVGVTCMVWYFLAKPKPVPVALKVLQTRAASETGALQTLFDSYASEHPQLSITVSYVDPSILREKAGTGFLPDFDVLVTDQKTLAVLQEHKELVEWAGDPESAASQVDLPFYEEGYLLLYYNKKLVRTPPETWQELVAQTVVQASPSQKRYGLAMPEEAFALLPFISRAFLGDQGTLLETVQEGLVREGIETVRTLRQTFSLTPRDCSAECSVRVFLGGQAPFALAGEWRWRDMARQLGPNLGMAPLPRLGSGKSLSARTTVFLAASRSTHQDNVSMLLDLKNYFQSAEGAARLFSQLGKLPSPYLSRTVEADDAQARSLMTIVQESSVRVEEETYLPLLARLRPALEEYLAGVITASELIERLGRPQPES